MNVKTRNLLKPNRTLVSKIDVFADLLMSSATAAGLKERCDVLEAVTKWVGVRDKLSRVEELEGAGLSADQAAINGPRTERAGGAGGNAAGTKAAAADNRIGSELEHFRALLPDAHLSRVGGTTRPLASPYSTCKRLDLHRSKSIAIERNVVIPKLRKYPFTPLPWHDLGVNQSFLIPWPKSPIDMTNGEKRELQNRIAAKVHQRNHSKRNDNCPHPKRFIQRSDEAGIRISRTQ
jgi:hypothetical protein